MKHTSTLRTSPVHACLGPLPVAALCECRRFATSTRPRRSQTAAATWRLAAVLFALILHTSSLIPCARAQGTAFTYQGFLTDQGAPANGAYDLEFRVFDAVTSGAQQGSLVTISDLGVTNGLFTVTLDPGVGVFTGAARWLNVAVRPGVSAGAYPNVVPRQPITAAPYAIFAGGVSAAGISGAIPAGQLSGTLAEAQLPANTARLTVTNTAQQATGTPVLTGNFVTGANVTFGGSGYPTPPLVTVNASAGSGAVVTATISNGMVTLLTATSAGNGYTNGATLSIAAPPSNAYQTFPGTNIFTNTGNVFGGNGANLSGLWRLAGNGGTTPGVNFLGTTDNLPLELRVNGSPVLRLLPNANAPNIIGGAAGNFIASGVEGAVIAGGGGINTNTLEANYSTIGGGRGNLVQTNALFSTIAGGSLNKVQFNAVGSTISGGQNNTVQSNSFQSTISGGAGNTIQVDIFGSTIGGGANNAIQGHGDFRTISGGDNNTIQPQTVLSTIGGGSFNTIRYGGSATIAGGNANFTGDAVVLTGSGASVGGGSQNIASGDSATVPGGTLNWASGAYSFAAGRRAKALNAGSFVWADSTDADFGYSGADKFQVRASGGVLFYANTGATIGVYLAPGGNSWAPTSDRNAKENFREVDPQEILAKLAAMPVLDYNLKSQDKTIRHLGPMAQDFAAAFGLGEDNLHITTIDADGVALSAIKGLNQKVEEQKAENAELKQRLEAMEKLLKRLTATKEGGVR